MWLQVGFHYPSSRPELPSWRPVNSGAFFDARVHGPCTRASGFHYPSSRPELTGVKKCTRVLGPWTRVVETDLYRGLNKNSVHSVQHCFLLPLSKLNGGAVPGKYIQVWSHNSISQYTGTLSRAAVYIVLETRHVTMLTVAIWVAKKTDVIFCLLVV